MCGMIRAIRNNAHLTGRRRESAAPSPFGRSRRLTPVLYSIPHFACKEIFGFRRTLRDTAGEYPDLTGRPHLRLTYLG